jgi:hypothetical protein
MKDKAIRQRSDAVFTPDESKIPEASIGEGWAIFTSKSTLFQAEGITRGFLKRVVSVDCILKVKDSFSLNFAVLFTYVLILNREGFSVPSNTEAHYLLQLAKLWDANFLSSDWTFSGPLSSHFFFNLFFGPLTLIFSLELVGWIGRIISWSLIMVGLLQLGKHFRIPRWMITVSILLWLLHNQSIVGGEYILGTFEAKSIAYAFLFFSLSGFIHQKRILPPILLGMAFSFHPLVGLWAALAVGLTLTVLRYPTDAIVKFGCYTTLFASPGLIPLLLTAFQGGSEFSEASRFVAFVVMPYHFDPFYFGKGNLLLLLVILLSFNWLHFRSDSKNSGLRFLLSFQALLGLFFVLGFVGRYTENYQLLLLMPCRLFPVLLPMFFFLHLMAALRHCHSLRYGMGLVVLGFVAFASFGNPIDVFVKNVKHQYSMWTRGEEDVKKAFRWIAGNTPTESIVISPPWRGDSFYLSQRGQIASWWIIRFDRLETTKARLDQMAHHYNQLTTTDIESLVNKYGAAYLVSSANYSYPALFNSGSYKVYSLKTAGAPGTKG